MEESYTEKRDWQKNILDALLVFGIIALLFLVWNLLGGDSLPFIQKQSYSNLINTEKIAALSVSDFVYNGIVQAYKENGDHDYNVLYKSTVKVSVNAEKIAFSVDEENKKVTFMFPELTLDAPLVDVDSISIIPNRNDLFMSDIVASCRKDALAEANESSKLISVAQDNLRSIIEAWYSPVMKEYSFEFIFDTVQGGEAE